MVTKYRDETAKLDSMLNHAQNAAAGDDGEDDVAAKASGVGSAQNSDQDASDLEADDDADDRKDGKSKCRSRRELPARAVSILKEWLLSEEHFTHPYPTTQDQARLMELTGIGKKQLKNWFTNARRRIWKPMIKKQLEEAKNAAVHGMTPAEAERAAAVAHAAHTAGISRGPYDPMFQGMASYGQPQEPPPGYYSHMFHHSSNPHPMAPHPSSLYANSRGGMNPAAGPGPHSSPAAASSGHHGRSAPATASGGPMPRISSLGGFGSGMPRAPSVGQFADNIKKTDSMAFLELFLQDAAHGGSGEGLLARSQSLSSLGLPFSSSGNLEGIFIDGDDDGSRSGLTAAQASALSDAIPPAASLLELRSSGSSNNLSGHKRALDSLGDLQQQGPDSRRYAVGPPRGDDGDQAYTYQQRHQHPLPPPPPAFSEHMPKATSKDLIRRVSSHELVNQGKLSSPDEEVMGSAIRVSSTAKCAFCVDGDVDTQLRPCGHLFHGRCLKPWLQASSGPPRCLQCKTPISSCVLAIPGPPNGPGGRHYDGAGTGSWRAPPSPAAMRASEDVSNLIGGSNDITQDAPTIEGDDFPKPHEKVRATM